MVQQHLYDHQTGGDVELGFQIALPVSLHLLSIYQLHMKVEGCLSCLLGIWHGLLDRSFQQQVQLY